MSPLCVALQVNRTVENIGARRLNTIIEKLVDDISFKACLAPTLALERHTQP